MGAEIVQAVYRAKPGKEDELAALLAKHQPVLQAEGLITERPAVLMRSPQDGTFIEIFEWATETAAHEAHTNEAVQGVWNAMTEVADFLTLADVPEATVRFAHFEPV